MTDTPAAAPDVQGLMFLFKQKMLSYFDPKEKLDGNLLFHFPFRAAFSETAKIHLSSIGRDVSNQDLTSAPDRKALLALAAEELFKAHDGIGAYGALIPAGRHLRKDGSAEYIRHARGGKVQDPAPGVFGLQIYTPSGELVKAESNNLPLPVSRTLCEQFMKTGSYLVPGETPPAFTPPDSRRAFVAPAGVVELPQFLARFLAPGITPA